MIRMEEKEVDAILANMVKDKFLDVEVKKDADYFSMTNKAKKHAENLLTTNPELTLFYLSLARENEQKFYSMIKEIAELLEKKKVK